jgi:NADPH2:quinone reductase
MAKDLIEAIEDGDVEIPVHAKYRLDEVVAVHKALAARETTGATVLLP